MTMTAVTPMMMPSMVKNVRILLERTFFMARRNVSEKLMSASGYLAVTAMASTSAIHFFFPFIRGHLRRGPWGAGSSVRAGDSSSFSSISCRSFLWVLCENPVSA